MAEPDLETLITVQQAIRLLDEVAVSASTVHVPLDQSVGLRLAQDLLADRDYPPFQKSLMDGYAVRSVDVVGGRAELRVVGTIAAGQAPHRQLQHGETMAIMTGAALPGGADGVVPVEDVAARVAVGNSVKILRAPSPGRYVAARGSDCFIGRKVLAKGTMIGPAQIAVMASIGAAEVTCFARPQVAILGTGDELVSIDRKPSDTQIRDSNTHMLAALLRRLGCDVVDIATTPDDPDLIRSALIRGMAYDALFISGGMSMGEFDYVPRLLKELGVDVKIAKLRIKPGKPFVFGVGEGSGFGAKGSGQSSRIATESTTPGASAGADAPVANTVPNADPSLNPEPQAPNPPPPRCYVFGLPGNPVSTYVCTLRLASRLLTRLAGGVPEDRWVSGRLDGGLLANGPREFYQPAIRHWGQGQHSIHAAFATITPLQWKGSADLFMLATANVLIVRAENEPAVPKGTVVRVLEI